MTMTTSGLFADGAVVRTTGSAVVYGAGGVGHEVFRVLREAGIRVQCVLDRRARPGDMHADVPLHSLESCPMDRHDRANVPVVIGIFNRSVDVPTVAQQLRAAGFAKIVSFVDLHAEFGEALGDRFWLTGRDVIDRHRADISRAESVLADVRSVTVYRSLIALRECGEYGSGLRPSIDDVQYLPSDVPGWLARTPVRFVDCGAYRGDTLEELLAAGVDIAASAHFEPDIENFVALVSLLRAQRAASSTAALAWPCAVSDRTQLVPFGHGGDEASRISAAASGTVAAVALDDVLVGWQPTFVKMDIEGSEIEALIGARTLIGADRPSLAICVYHRPDHLWRIPLLVSSWPELSGYRYYLRAHAFDGFDTVLYANPSEVLS